MSFRMTPLTAATLFTGALAGLAPVAAHADVAGDQWKFDASIYLWTPAIGGDTSFPSGSGNSSLDVSSEDVVDALKMAFMGTVSAKKGQWGIWSDLVYADFGAKKSGSFDGYFNNVSINANLKYDIKTWIWTAAATYEIVKTPNYTIDLLAGTRYLDVTQNLDWSLNGTGPLGLNPTGSAEVSSEIWDGIVGVKGVAYLGDEKQWFIPYYADIGSGQSDLTWQVNAGIGYRFGWGDLVATWRYLDYEMDSNEPISSVNLNGPLFGATFHW